MSAWYNEIDPYAAEWLRNLIRSGHIAPGEVDERSIEDVLPDELAGFDQCHFFAGIGVWSYALRRVGWPDDRPVWTGSCPCQPFSAAGKGAGFDDERHLWPAWHHLIAQCRPATVLGEQVASKDGLGWLDLVQADLEGTGYACGAVDLCAAGVGAPHIRQRLWFAAERMADADDTRPQGRIERGNGTDQRASRPGGMAGGLADAYQQQFDRSGNAGPRGRGEPANSDTTSGMEHTGSIGRQWRQAPASRHNDDGKTPIRPQGEYGTGEPSTYRVRPEQPGPVNGFWRDADWLYCRDGKWRPVEARIQQVVDGHPIRVGPLCSDLQTRTEEIINETSKRLSVPRTEILRTVREITSIEGIFRKDGGAIFSHEAQILLSFLLELTGEKGREPHAKDGASTRPGTKRELRVLWRGKTASYTSYQRRLARQSPREFANALRILSSAVARFAQEAGYPVLYADAPASFPLGVGTDQCNAQDTLGKFRPKNRVGRLRAYGNAINAEAATAFIASYMDREAAA